MAGRRRRSPSAQRRREFGQHLLVDRKVVQRAVDRMAVRSDDLVVEIGPGRGALTVPLARAGAAVVAVERDPKMVTALRATLDQAGVAGRVKVIRSDIRRFRWPQGPYRVVGNLPFGLTTAILEQMLDHPVEGPTRADILVQSVVARNRADVPPSSLRSAAWAPWWTLEVDEVVSRTAFRPPPSVDAAWLKIERRHPPVLPVWLAPAFRDTLRTPWAAHNGGRA